MKIGQARRILERGETLQVRVRFRGREIVHRELGDKVGWVVVNACSDVGMVHGVFTLVGKEMIVTVHPKRRHG